MSARAEALRAAVLALCAGLLVVGLAPAGGDSAAHLYRTLLVREGVIVWDNLWFAGHYPLASYSLLYYLPAALVGNIAVVLASVVLSATLFASVAVHEWGATARWPARAFAVLAAGPLFTGTYSYAAGLAAALAALRLLQVGRPRLALVCGALTLGFSPLAFVFLTIVLVAIAVARRDLGRRTLLFAGGVAGLALIELALLSLFSSEGRYPFSALSLAAVLTVCVLGAAVAVRAERGTALAAFFVLWALVNLAGFAVTSPVGDNLTRLRAVVFPLVLLAAALARFRPPLLAGAAIAFALVYNLAPDVSALPKRVEDARTAEQSFWDPALDFLRGQADANHRVEVVPTFGHWEAWWVPRAGFALARGWFRQIDLAENPELYRDPLRAAVYRRWLEKMAVRYVLLPRARLGPLGATREAELLRSGAAGLPVAFRHRDWTVYEVPRAPGILSGGTLDVFGHERIAGRVAGPGAYRLAVRYTGRWSVVTGPVCLERAADGMMTLRARRGGPFTLEVRLRRGGAACS